MYVSPLLFDSALDTALRKTEARSKCLKLFLESNYIDE
jgi:hypothetical protein